MACPACSGSFLESTHNEFLRCCTCGLGFLVPSARERHHRAIRDGYQTASGRAPESDGERDHKGRVARKILEVSHRGFLLNPSTAYEIGAGSGYMVNAMRGEGVIVKGNDVFVPKDQPRECWDSVPFDRGEQMGSPTYQMVYAWDSMEHLFDIEAAFQRIRSMLTSPGIFVMHSPNFSRYKDNPQHPYWDPGHLWHLTPEAVKHLGKKYLPGEWVIDHGHLGGDPGLAAADNFVAWMKSP